MAALQPTPRSRGETWAGALCLGFSISEDLCFSPYYIDLGSFVYVLVSQFGCKPVEVRIQQIFLVGAL